MQNNYLFTGCFFSPTALYAAVAPLRTGRLAHQIPAPHVTFAFKPDFAYEAWFGTPLQCRITGYASDGKNEGLQVELVSDRPFLQKLIDTIPVPHITLSVSEDGNPINTRYLRFQPVEPIELTGVYGGYSRNQQVITGKGGVR